MEYRECLCSLNVQIIWHVVPITFLSRIRNRVKKSFSTSCWKFRENLCIYLNERSPPRRPAGLYIYGVSLNEKFSFSVARDFRVFTSSESIGLRYSPDRLFYPERWASSCSTREILSMIPGPRPFSQITDPIRSILDRFSAADRRLRLEEISARLRYERKRESGRGELFRVLFVDASDIKLTSNFLSRVVSLPMSRRLHGDLSSGSFWKVCRTFPQFVNDKNRDSLFNSAI